MHAYFLLSLPRLHPELASLPEGCRTLWPGLPRRPEHAWAPELPWPPALAQDRALPLISVRVTMVLLKEERM